MYNFGCYAVCPPNTKTHIQKRICIFHQKKSQIVGISLVLGSFFSFVIAVCIIAKIINRCSKVPLLVDIEPQPANIVANNENQNPNPQVNPPSNPEPIIQELDLNAHAQNIQNIGEVELAALHQQT